ncbi:hypothetical protein [Marinigracilibium pacificum]|uniref:Lipocalin-like domain-containing protein n=1 Tax=Marinigracilibium pacificum TaxID=2729599 RepID=A0A848IYC2_9BACT|nr:hypothetical protein [Marinigracilibium pacificum]NMM47290.1 hypothetical protein [Marinigracilibium pacificum]
MKKNRILLALPLLFLALFINVSCDDDDETTDPLVGLYVLSNATTNEAIIYQDNEIVAANSNITAQIGAALLSDVTCTTASNARVELAANKEVNYTCKGEGVSEKQGTWFYSSQSQSLNLSLDLFGQVTPVILQNFEDDGTKIEGDVELPTFPANVINPDLTGFVSLDMHIVFTRDSN